MWIKDIDYYKEKLANLEKQKKELTNKMRANQRSFEGTTEEGELIPKSEAGIRMANELIILDHEIKSMMSAIVRLEP